MVGGNAGWRQGLQDQAAVDQLIKLTVVELQTRTQATVHLDEMAGSVGDGTGRFVARMEPLARAVAQQPRVAWPGLVAREVSRWCDAISTAERPHLVAARLRVRPVMAGESAGYVTRPPFWAAGGPHWEIVADYPGLLIFPAGGTIGDRLWRMATRNTIAQAVAGGAVLEGCLPSAGDHTEPRVMRVLSGLYAGSLLLDFDALAAVAGVSNFDRWRLWLISGSLLMLAEAHSDDSDAEHVQQVLDSLTHFASLSGNRFQPIAVMVPVGTRPKPTFREPHHRPEPPTIR